MSYTKLGNACAFLGDALAFFFVSIARIAPYNNQAIPPWLEKVQDAKRVLAA